jgi:hypothetical protein
MSAILPFNLDLLDIQPLYSSGLTQNIPHYMIVRPESKARVALVAACLIAYNTIHMSTPILLVGFDRGFGPQPEITIYRPESVAGVEYFFRPL